jgi:prolipoprotein diacylglyceryltransferase
MDPFGTVYVVAFGLAVMVALAIHRSRAELWHHLPSLLVVVVLTGYATSTGTKALIYGTWLELGDAESAGTHFYGFAIGATVGTFVYSRLAKMDFPRFLDAVYPAVLAGSCVGRIGCFVAGCCGGSVFGLPAQLVSSSLDGCACLVLTTFRLRPQLAPAWAARDGMTAVAATLCYGACRWTLEWFRTEPRIAAGWTLAQWLALATGAVAVAAAVGCMRSPAPPHLANPSFEPGPSRLGGPAAR